MEYFEHVQSILYTAKVMLAGVILCLAVPAVFSLVRFILKKGEHV